jgi:HEAT repeat protein
MVWKTVMKRNGIYLLVGALFLAGTAAFIKLGTNFHALEAADVAATPVNTIGAAEAAKEVSPNLVSVQKSDNSTQGSAKDPIADALEKIRSSDIHARIIGIQVLARLSPPDAVSVLYESLSRLETEPNIEGMIVLGMLNLARADKYFTDSDLEYIFRHTLNDNINGRAARILAARGDERLLVEHIDKFKWQGEAYSSEAAIKSLAELGALQTKLALPHITPYLSSDDEEVRLRALLSVSLCANADEIEQVKPLLADTSGAVRERAEAVIKSLQGRGKQEPAPIDMAITHSYGT